MLQSLIKKSFLILSVALLGLWSCQKELDDFPANNTSTDLSTKVNSSVSGFVTDENNQAVNGATVTMGGQTTTTDAYGYFVIRNVQVIKNAAVVTVKKSGYFPGIKTYIATADKSAFFRIQLIPKTTQGTFNATSGGNVVLSNGLSVSFPSAAVVNASTGSAYNGTVNVAISWINPTASNIYSIMPGDLRGINASGALQILQSYGMAAVELTGSNGELLQIASGKKATLSFPIPASISSTAPASIPLWYFDETLGLWKEEGSATKNGNTYVGEVSHFSFWNCDVPSNYVHFDCTVVDANGNPMPYVLVKVSVVGNPYSAGYGLTDSSGYTGGAVPNNAALNLEVFTNYNCGTAVYSQQFNTTNTSISLGNIVIPASVINQANVTGNVINCSGGAVTNGSLIIQRNNQFYRYNLDANGAFDFNAILCSGPENVTLIGEDYGTSQQSTPVNFTINTGSNTVPTIQACGISATQFFNYTINGTNYSMTAPADSFYYYVNPQTTPTQIVVNGSSSSATSTYITVGFDQTGIAVGSAQQMSLFYSNSIADSTNFTTPIMVNITEYGPVGAFVAGNYSGTFTGGAPLNTPYVISGSFRVRRTQ